MRHVTTIFSILFMLFLFSSETAFAQLVQVRIGVPPPPPRVVVVERPPCSGHNYVWVEGHYIYDRYTRRDVWISGQWEYVEPRYIKKGHGHGRARGHERREERDRYYGRN